MKSVSNPPPPNKEMKNMKVNLGDLCKDVVSGFRGIAVSRHSYLQGCDRISIQPPVGEDGNHPSAVAFDEGQIEVLEKQVVNPDPAPQAQRTGGAEKYSDQGKSSGDR